MFGIKYHIEIYKKKLGNILFNIAPKKKIKNGKISNKNLKEFSLIEVVTLVKFKEKKIPHNLLVFLT